MEIVARENACYRLLDPLPISILCFHSICRSSH
jgi:hypothetical protein